MNHRRPRIAWLLLVTAYLCPGLACGQQPQSIDARDALEAPRSAARSSPPHLVSDGVALAELNPIFLRIVLGVVREDAQLLRASADELDAKTREKPQTRTAASLAKLVIFEQIPDQIAYAEQVSAIAGWERLDANDAGHVGRTGD